MSYDKRDASTDDKQQLSLVSLVGGMRCWKRVKTGHPMSPSFLPLTELWEIWFDGGNVLCGLSVLYGNQNDFRSMPKQTTNKFELVSFEIDQNCEHALSSYCKSSFWN